MRSTLVWQTHVRFPPGVAGGIHCGPGNPPKATDAVAAIAFVEDSMAYTRRVWDGIGTDTLLTTRPDPFFFGATRRPYDWLVYCIENEIHHRGQGYVYLRQLGVDPPHFWER